MCVCVCVRACVCVCVYVREKPIENLKIIIVMTSWIIGPSLLQQRHIFSVTICSSDTSFSVTHNIHIVPVLFTMRALKWIPLILSGILVIHFSSPKCPPSLASNFQLSSFSFLESLSVYCTANTRLMFGDAEIFGNKHI